MEEFVVKVKFPCHERWDDEEIARVKSFLFDFIDNTVKSLYNTEWWKTSGVELV